jgi:hypothetical protein
VTGFETITPPQCRFEGGCQVWIRGRETGGGRGREAAVAEQETEGVWLDWNFLGLELSRRAEERKLEAMLMVTP